MACIHGQHHGQGSTQCHMHWKESQIQHSVEQRKLHATYTMQLKQLGSRTPGSQSTSHANDRGETSALHETVDHFLDRSMWKGT